MNTTLLYSAQATEREKQASIHVWIESLQCQAEDALDSGLPALALCLRGLAKALAADLAPWLAAEIKAFHEEGPQVIEARTELVQAWVEDAGYLPLSDRHIRLMVNSCDFEGTLREQVKAWCQMARVPAKMRAVA